MGGGDGAEVEGTGWVGGRDGDSGSGVPEAEVEGEEQQRPAGSSNNSKHVD